MRVVDTDNFGSDYPDEKFVTGCVSKKEAERIADRMNGFAGDFSRRYYKVVEDWYTLQPGFEP